MNWKTEKLLDRKFIKVFDLQYAEGKHYFNATRRDAGNLVCEMNDADFESQIPDAVSCVLILENDGEEPKIVINREMRYPLGRYVLSIPAGLIDREDTVLPRDEAIKRTAIREIREETGLEFREGDEISIINPCLFSSPGMTDESNAVVKVIIRNRSIGSLNSKGCCGTEDISGYAVLNKAEAAEALKSGCLPAYSWIALTCFVGM